MERSGTSLNTGDAMPDRDPLTAYVQAWSEPDTERAQALLAAGLHAQAQIVGPGYRLDGLAAAQAEIARFHRDQPGWRAVATSGVDRHGRWARFTVALHDAAGALVHEGWDIVEQGDDGLVHRVVTFWGPLPSISPALERRTGPTLSKETEMTDRTVRLHRVFRAPPARVYQAFLNAEALAKWLPPYGFTCTVHHLEARVGGSFRMSFRNFSTGHAHSFGGDYLELVPDERLRYTDRFDDPNLPGTLEVTVSLKAVVCGTEVSIAQTGIPAVIPLEMCYLGWQESLAQLATLVEPDIPG